MIKAHTPINWENEPSFNTPINETNLNKMDSTIGVLDDRIIEQETSKLDKATAYTMVKDISFNENNGVFTVTRLNNSTFTIDTKLEKISINFSYNAETQQIEIILIDGTKQYIDISSLISPIDFVDSDTIGWEVTEDGKVQAKVLDGSITEDMLQPNYLAEIKVETAKSQQSMANAKISENNAKQSELNAKASEEQALEYSNNAQPLAQSVSGNNPTATNSTNASVIYLNNKGYTNQEKLAFDGLVATTTNGIKNTNPIPCKQGDSITVTVSTGLGAITVYNSNNEPLLAIPQLSEPPSKTTTFTIDADVTGIFIEIETTATTMEITVNGSAYVTPSPDVPIHIGASADKGYFDGELRQGLYLSADGSFSSATHFICSANKISCKENDSIVVQYEKNVKNIRATFYKVDGTFISTLGATNIDTNKIEVIAPTESDYFHISIGLNSGDSLLVADAKHICVTINGMYAVRVKTQNKNLLVNTATTTTINGVAFTVNDDGSVTCSGTATAYTAFYLGEHIQNLEVGKSYKSVGVTNCKNVVSGSNKFENMFTVTEGYTSVRPYIEVSNGVSVNKIYYPMIVSADETDDTYEPHQETTALIPVSAPLYDGDYIEVYADGSGREYRVNGDYILDATKSWSKTGINIDRYFQYYTVLGIDVNKQQYSNMKCTHFTRNNEAETIGFFTSNNGAVGFAFSEKDSSTVDDWKNFLSNNELHLIYPLATPTSTPLTAEQVAEFMKLQTFKGVTHITADGEMVMRYYCNNASGETAAMLQKMIQGIS